MEPCTEFLDCLDSKYESPGVALVKEPINLYKVATCRFSPLWKPQTDRALNEPVKCLVELEIPPYSIMTKPVKEVFPGAVRTNCAVTKKITPLYTSETPDE